MHLFLAVTLYEDKLHGGCSESVLKNCISLMNKGHKVMPYYNNDLYIDRSRNFCVSLFLDQDCSDIVFIDSDLEFDDDAILKLIKYDKDIVAGSYRYKEPEEGYPVTLDFSRGGNCKEEATGLVYATRAPTGLMRINRRVFEKMIPHYRMKSDERNIFPFFETGMLELGGEEDNNWWGEDTAFCRKWIDMGGEVFVEPRMNITHSGSQKFTGNYHEYLMNRSLEKIDLDGVDSGIPGWMTEDELSILKYLAARADSIVEVGCWKGRSTKALLESCNGIVHAVDHWCGTEGDSTILAAYKLNIYNDFIKNVGHYPNLKILKGSSQEKSKEIEEVDMVFIDAGHSYEECKNDIELWLPKCRKIIAGHDYTKGYPGVIKAVSEKFSKINLINSVWWVEL